MYEHHVRKSRLAKKMKSVKPGSLNRRNVVTGTPVCLLVRVSMNKLLQTDGTALPGITGDRCAVYVDTTASATKCF